MDIASWPVPFQSLSLPAIALVHVAYLAGFAIRGSFGFGSNLPAVLVTAWVLGPHHAVLLAALVAMLAQLQLMPQGVNGAHWGRVVPVVITMFFGTAVGVWLLTIIEADWLLLVLAVLIGIMVVTDRLRLLERVGRFIDVRSPRVAASVGTVSSMMSTLSGGGALYLLAPYLKLAAASPLEFRNTNVMIGGIAGLARVLMLSAAGLVTFELLLDAASLLPAITLGTWIGTRYFRAVSAERFFATLQWMLLLAAALLAVKGVGLLLES